MLNTLPVLQSYGLTAILTLVVALIVVWAVVSIPVWLAAKAVTKGKATFGQAMGATVLGPIIFVVVLVASTFFLGILLGGLALVIALILALLGWVWAFKASFHTGWLAAFGIAVLAIAISFILVLVIDFIMAGALVSLIPSLSFPAA